MHGPVPLLQLAPDLLFHDLPSHMVISGGDVTLGRLLGKGMERVYAELVFKCERQFPDKLASVNRSSQV